eukprot:scaffold20400_cov56-Skeletonema_dohrnii-CCMP3373.AAC.2
MMPLLRIDLVIQLVLEETRQPTRPCAKKEKKEEVGSFRERRWTLRVIRYASFYFFGSKRDVTILICPPVLACL